MQQPTHSNREPNAQLAPPKKPQPNRDAQTRANRHLPPPPPPRRFLRKLAGRR